MATRSRTGTGRLPEAWSLFLSPNTLWPICLPAPHIMRRAPSCSKEGSYGELLPHLRERGRPCCSDDPRILFDRGVLCGDPGAPADPGAAVGRGRSHDAHVCGAEADTITTPLPHSTSVRNPARGRDQRRGRATVPAGAPRRSVLRRSPRAPGPPARCPQASRRSGLRAGRGHNREADRRPLVLCASLRRPLGAGAGKDCRRRRALQELPCSVVPRRAVGATGAQPGGASSNPTCLPPSSRFNVWTPRTTARDPWWSYYLGERPGCGHVAAGDVVRRLLESESSLLRASSFRCLASWSFCVTVIGPDCPPLPQASSRDRTRSR